MTPTHNDRARIDRGPWRSFTALLIVGVVVSVMTLPAIVNAVEPGEVAPELKVAEWIENGPVVLRPKNAGKKGEDVAVVDGEKKKKIHVIEFWATWCPPCRESFPVLCELADKHKDDGLVVVGVTKEKPDVVKAFLRDDVKKINYNIAIDDHGRTTLAYLGRDLSIPKAFVVENGENVLWKGHPMDLGRVLTKVFDGSFDLDEQRELSDLRRRMQVAMREADDVELIETSEKLLRLDPLDTLALRTRLYVFEKNGQNDLAVEFLDDLIDRVPNEPTIQLLKLRMLAKSTLGAEGVRRHAEEMAERFKNDPETLSKLSWGLLDWIGFGDAPLDVALSAARTSVDTCSLEDDPNKKATRLAILARACYAAGLLDEALKKQLESAALSTDEKRATALVDFYRRAKELRDRQLTTGIR